MRAIAFDLGDTLVEYEGIPLSWEAHYPEALANLAAALGIVPDSDQLARACAILRHYNTRIHPRENEVSFAVILAELAACFEYPFECDELDCATSFFSIFRRRLRSFPDVKPALSALREKGLKIGVFTDVPYGMPRALVLDEVTEVSLVDSFDVIMTSRDAGFRKPSIETLRALARELDCNAAEMTYIGNERKDIDVARAFGCRSILLDRQRHGNDWGQSRAIASLSEL